MEKENRSVVLLFQCGRFEYALGQILVVRDELTWIDN